MTSIYDRARAEHIRRELRRRRQAVEQRRAERAELTALLDAVTDDEREGTPA